MQFKKEIENFQRYGTYNYKYDSAGNVIFVSPSLDFSKTYLALPIFNFSYNISKIEQLYDIDFQEFIPEQNESKIDITTLQAELEFERFKNVELSTKLNSMIESEVPNMSEIDKLAAKQVILELRKALGQGRVDSDFFEDFPYSPIRKNTNILSEYVSLEPVTTKREIVDKSDSTISPIPSSVNLPTSPSTVPTPPVLPPSTPPFVNEDNVTIIDPPFVNEDNVTIIDNFPGGGGGGSRNRFLKLK